MHIRSLKPHRIVIFSFLITIIIGGVLLSLPQSCMDRGSIGIIDAFFTATSATCVTGLTVKDIGKDFSRFGQIIILSLIQIGGLGIMTLSTFFAVFFGKKLTIRENTVMKSALDRQSVEGLTTLIQYILVITFSIEAIGVVLLYHRFGDIYFSIFHSISAFCNAGFSLNTTNLSVYNQDAYVNFVIAGLIILGGIGFVVIIDIPGILKASFKQIIIKRGLGIKQILSKVNLQTKIVISVTFILIFVGTVVIFLLEKNRLFSMFTLRYKILASFFQSVTSRTAGFNTIPIGMLTSPTLFFIIMLMFIGASPGSTGGGVKTCTLAIIFAGARSMIKGEDNIHLFKKSIPKPIFKKAVMIAGFGIMWVVVFTMILCFIEDRNEAIIPNYFLSVLFEVTSAFGTVGLSTGITNMLSPFGKIFVMLTMFIGRIGPLTLPLALIIREQKVFYKYPEEKVMVG